MVYLPYFAGKLSLADLLSAHNDHRIFFHRVYSLGLLLLNRQWDGQLQMVGNAILHCATLTGLGCLMCRWIQSKYWILVWLPLVLVLVLPFGWENSISGFQSFFYFAVTFSLLALWLLGLYPPGSIPWWCGAAAAIMVLFTLSSGFLAAVAIFGLEVLRICRQPNSWKQRAPTLAFCGTVSLVGVLLLVDVKHHHVFRAHSIVEFITALANNLAWPWIVLPFFAILNLVPLGMLTWRYFHEEKDDPAQQITLAIGLWVVLLGAAAAYARGAGGNGPGWRHMEFSSFILVANCFSIATLMSCHQPVPAASGKAQLSICNLQLTVSRPALVTVFVLWGFACAAGLVLLNLRAWQVDIREREFYSRCHIHYTRSFMATDDVHVFDRASKPQLPAYQGNPLEPPLRYDAEWIVEYLRNPVIRDILPACVRDPLEVRMSQAETHGFVTNGFRLARREQPTEISWGSFTEDGAAAKGRFESLPIPRSKLPFLEFRVAGNLGKPGLSLNVVELNSGKTTSVKPPQVPGDNWQSCQVRAPNGDFKLVASDESDSGWFAFQAPREVGWLSWAAARLASFGGSIFLTGLGLYFFGLASVFRSRRGGNSQEQGPNGEKPPPVTS